MENYKRLFHEPTTLNDRELSRISRSTYFRSFYPYIIAAGVPAIYVNLNKNKSSVFTVAALGVVAYVVGLQIAGNHPLNTPERH